MPDSGVKPFRELFIVTGGMAGGFMLGLLKDLLKGSLSTSTQSVVVVNPASVNTQIATGVAAVGAIVALSSLYTQIEKKLPSTADLQKYMNDMIEMEYGDVVGMATEGGKALLFSTKRALTGLNTDEVLADGVKLGAKAVGSVLVAKGVNALSEQGKIFETIVSVATFSVFLGYTAEVKKALVTLKSWATLSGEAQDSFKAVVKMGSNPALLDVERLTEIVALVDAASDHISTLTIEIARVNAMMQEIFNEQRIESTIMAGCGFDPSMVAELVTTIGELIPTISTHLGSNPDQLNVQGIMDLTATIATLIPELVELKIKHNGEVETARASGERAPEDFNARVQAFVRDMKTRNNPSSNPSRPS